MTNLTSLRPCVQLLRKEGRKWRREGGTRERGREGGSEVDRAGKRIGWRWNSKRQLGGDEAVFFFCHRFTYLFFTLYLCLSVVYSVYLSIQVSVFILMFIFYLPIYIVLFTWIIRLFLCVFLFSGLLCGSSWLLNVLLHFFFFASDPQRTQLSGMCNQFLKAMYLASLLSVGTYTLMSNRRLSPFGYEKPNIFNFA